MSFVQSYMEWVEPRSESPETFHKLAALAMCAAALGDRVWFQAKFGHIFPHFWLACVGPSSVQKTSAIRPAVLLLRAAIDGVCYPKLFSMEALIERLPQQPTGLIAWSEIGSAMETFSKDYSAGVLSLLIELWDSRSPIDRETKAMGRIIVERPALTIIGAGKVEWFRRYVRDVSNGWMGRWLFSYEDDPGPFKRLYSANGTHAEAEEYQWAGLVDHLRTLSQFSGGEIAPGHGGDVLDDWREKNRRWSDAEDPAQFTSRGAENIVKLAIAIQASQGSHELYELNPKAVEQAITLWEYCYKSGCTVVTAMADKPSRDGEEMIRLSETMRKLRVATRSEALRAARYLDATTFDRLMGTLIQREDVFKQTVRPEGAGRPTMTYQWVRK